MKIKLYLDSVFHPRLFMHALLTMGTRKCIIYATDGSYKQNKLQIGKLCPLSVPSIFYYITYGHSQIPMQSLLDITS